MNSDKFQHDLVALVADKDMQAAISGLLSRSEDLCIRPIQYTVIVHQHRDPGCRKDSISVLRQYITSCRYALVFFDFEGCGREHQHQSQEIAEKVHKELCRNGWKERSQVIVIDPELETWIWNDSPVVSQTMGWENNNNLRSFLRERGLWIENRPKPMHPKEAMRAALFEKKIAVSSSLFKAISEESDFSQCRNKAFVRLLATLRLWFPPNR